jgi:hypothetical protein
LSVAWDERATHDLGFVEQGIPLFYLARRQHMSLDAESFAERHNPRNLDQTVGHPGDRKAAGAAKARILSGLVLEGI